MPVIFFKGKLAFSVSSLLRRQLLRFSSAMSTYSKFTILVQMCSGIGKSAHEAIGAWPAVQAIICDWVPTPWLGSSCVAASKVRAGSVATGSVSAGIW